MLSAPLITWFIFATALGFLIGNVPLVLTIAGALAFVQSVGELNEQRKQLARMHAEQQALAIKAVEAQEARLRSVPDPD